MIDILKLISTYFDEYLRYYSSFVFLIVKPRVKAQDSQDYNKGTSADSSRN